MKSHQKIPLPTRSNTVFFLIIFLIGRERLEMKRSSYFSNHFRIFFFSSRYDTIFLFLYNMR